MVIQNPSKCSECEATDIKAMGASPLSFINEGENDQIHTFAFKCNKCGNLMFKLPVE